jgi:1-phosphofructokinase family hexose kinase
VKITFDMVFTLTPNPALDLGGVVNRLVPNEKSYVHQETRFPGGNAINAARMMKKLGSSVIAGGFLGGGIGQEVKRLLKQEGVRSQFVKISESTRVSVTVSHRKTHLQTRLSFAGPRVLPREVESLARWLAPIQSPSILVLGGSLPPGFSSLVLRSMIRGLRSRGVDLVLDMPARELSPLLASHPLLIKPNVIEFQELMGGSGQSVPSVVRAAKKLKRQISWICVSSVEGGALLINGNRAWWGQIPKIKIKSTVGAGDSMVGAMTSVLSLCDPGNRTSHELGESLLRWGLSAAGATLMTPGTQLGEVSQIRLLYPKIRIREVSL